MKVFSLIVTTVLLTTGAIGCKLKTENSELLVGRLTSTDKSVEVPKKLIKDIESYYLKNFRIVNPDVKKSDSEILSRVIRKTLNLKAKLISKSSGVLVKNTAFEAGRGGGFLDLAEWITDVRGDFYFSIKIKEEEEAMNPNFLRVYFVSRSPRTEINGENWGLGCSKYADITTFYNKVLSKRGIRLNSTLNRYFYVITGSFIFVGFGNKEIFLTSFSVTDSRFHNKLCVS